MAVHILVVADMWLEAEPLLCTECTCLLFAGDSSLELAPGELLLLPVAAEMVLATQHCPSPLVLELPVVVEEARVIPCWDGHLLVL